MKKIYLVYQDNGESYEDYYEWIKKVFDNKQEAENYKQMLEIEEEAAFKKAVEENDYREKCRFWIKEEELIEKGEMIMSKNYDLYPSYERKIDNWRRRILGYEKMKRDMQRQIQILKNKNKKQKEVINKIFSRITLWKMEDITMETSKVLDDLLDILKEVSK